MHIEPFASSEDRVLHASDDRESLISIPAARTRHRTGQSD